MLAKILDNMALASWTYICKLVALNNGKMDTGDVEVFNGFNGKRPQEKEHNGKKPQEEEHNGKTQHEEEEKDQGSFIDNTTSHKDDHHKETSKVGEETVNEMHQEAEEQDEERGDQKDLQDGQGIESKMGISL